MEYRVETIARTNDKCGEAPTWDAAGGRIIWTDNEGNVVYEMAVPGGQPEPLCRGLMVSGIAINQARGFVFAGSAGLHVWRGPGDCRTVVSEHDGEKLFFNDMIADSKGRIYAGTLYWGPAGMEKLGKLYLISPDGKTRVVEDGIELSNGLGFSPDNRTLYYTDSSARKIYAYEVDPESGTLAHKRLFVQVPGDEGIPDGLTVDAEGFVWSAQWYGAQVVRYDPQGRVERRIAMPAKQVSSVIFGGKDLDELYITSAANSWEGPYAPPGYDFKASDIGGSLYRVRVGVPGKLDHQAAFA